MGPQKTLLKAGLILGVLLCSVECVHFEFSAVGQPCILLDMDATFALSMGEQNAAPFTLDGANVTSSSSLCGSDARSAVLTLSLFPSSESLKVNFRRDQTQRTVALSVVLILDPVKHFENASGIQPFELEDSDDLPIGMMNTSYKCNSEEQLFFNQDIGFSMTMTITNFQAQAYDIVNGEYSEAIECDQDSLTSVPTTTSSPETTTMEDITTEPITVSTVPETTVNPETTTPEMPVTIEPESNVTETAPTLPTSQTEEPTTVSQEPVTISQEQTTLPQEPTTVAPTPRYEVKDEASGAVCIVLQGKIKFNIKYEKNDSQIAETGIEIPEDYKVEGQCAYDGSNTTQEFKLLFFKDTWSFSVQISEDQPALLRTKPLQAVAAAESYSWKNVELVYVIDDNFEDHKQADDGKTITITKEEDGGIFKASGQGSYKCNTEQVELGNDVNMDLGNFQYRAFGQDDSTDFPDGGIDECPSDNGGDDDDDDDTVAIVLGSVFGGLAFILLVGFGVYCLKKGKRQDYEVM